MYKVLLVSKAIKISFFLISLTHDGSNFMQFPAVTMLFPCPLYTGQEIGLSVPMGQYWASAQSVQLSIRI
jgi:hypothetical protein